MTRPISGPDALVSLTRDIPLAEPARKHLLDMLSWIVFRFDPMLKPGEHIGLYTRETSNGESNIGLFIDRPKDRPTNANRKLNFCVIKLTGHDVGGAEFRHTLHLDFDFGHSAKPTRSGFQNRPSNPRRWILDSPSIVRLSAAELQQEIEDAYARKLAALP